MRLICGDMREQETVADGSVAAVLTDPPYELGIARRRWDMTGVSFEWLTWRLCWEMLADGGVLMAFGSTRLHHRMVSAIEDAGFTIADEIPWLYAQGYPKGAGKLKPANEPITVAFKEPGPLALNAGERVAYKWPANVAVDEQVEAMLAKEGAPPFAFVAKPSPGERQLGALGDYHETVKPLKLMRWLVRLSTAPGDLVCDPFMGTGTTGAAALIEGRRFVGIEKDPKHFQFARTRIHDLVAPHGITIEEDTDGDP